MANIEILKNELGRQENWAIIFLPKGEYYASGNYESGPSFSKIVDPLRRDGYACVRISYGYLKDIAYNSFRTNKNELESMLQIIGYDRPVNANCWRLKK